MLKFLTLIFMLIPLALYSQTEDSLSHYKTKEIKTMSTFEELLYPGNEFFSIGLLPFNYYHFSDEISSGEDLAGYLGLNLGYYYAHSRKVFMSLSMGYSGMTDNTMFFGDNFDNINLTSVFEGNNYKGIPYTFEKEFEDLRFSFLENMAFENLIVSLGVGVNITKYRFFYKYQGKAEEGTETKFGLRTKKLVIQCLAPSSVCNTAS